jgi:SAM-dependent methyltransferase
MNTLKDSSDSPFDRMAPEYDIKFTDSVLGRLYRNTVWERMDCLFSGQRHILELGCGTGEDSLYLAGRGHRVTAIDASEKMIHQAQIKLEKAGYQDQVSFQVMDIENMNLFALHTLNEGDEKSIKYDGVLANFGVLNCVQDLDAVARLIHSCLSLGSPALVTIMGPLVPWEWLWYLFKGQPVKSFRRLRKGGVYWKGIRVRYPGVQKARASFAPYFRILHISALGCFLPPSYAESWAKNHPGTLNLLHRIECRWSSSPLVTNLADHYILEMERVE